MECSRTTVWSVQERQCGVYKNDSVEWTRMRVWSVQERQGGVYMNESVKCTSTTVWSVHERECGVYKYDSVECTRTTVRATLWCAPFCTSTMYTQYYNTMFVIICACLLTWPLRQVLLEHHSPAFSHFCPFCGIRKISHSVNCFYPLGLYALHIQAHTATQVYRKEQICYRCIGKNQSV